MIVQIYEIQTPEEAEKCIALGVDHIGSVLLERKDWLDTPIMNVIDLSKTAGVRNTLIPLFSDPDEISRALDHYAPAYVHFCHSLTDPLGEQRDLDLLINLQAQLKHTFPEIGIMRTIPIPRTGAGIEGFPYLEMAKAFEPVSDMFLIDTWVENAPVEGFVGITGEAADWGMSLELVIQSQIPVILAGGLSPDNVFEALLDVVPAGADSCTLTNSVSSDGKPLRFQKDFRLVERFVKEVRRAEEAIGLQRLELEKALEGLRSELREREAALPPHSVRPHQLLIIEELEEEIDTKEKELRRLSHI